MKYKLIRTDSSINTEFDLMCGTQSFGRNNFLDCDDKRVSRSHGEIEILQSGEISLKALHLNPCFIRKKGYDKVIILNQGDVTNISHDDQFGLLPSLYWYKVMEQSDASLNNANLPTEAVKTEPDFNNSVSSNLEASEVPNIIIKKEIVCEAENLNSSCTEPDSGEKEIVSNNVELFKMKRLHSEDGEIAVSPKLRRLSEGNSSTEATKEEAENTVKEELVNLKKELKEESCSANVEAVNPPQVINPAPQPLVHHAAAVLQIPIMPAMKRERCYYGSNCYRKNIFHKQQYSHPNDPDWGTDEMIPCPYGRLCRKLDQRHFRDHSHPPNIMLDDNLVQDNGSDDEEFHDGLDIGSEASVDMDYDF